MSLFSTLRSSLLGAGIAAAIAPLAAVAQVELPITEIRWYDYEPSTRIYWQSLRFTVPDPDVTLATGQGNLSRYDAHLAKMFEISHYLCQRNQATGYLWKYEAANGNLNKGTFRVACKLTEDIAIAYGFKGAESTAILRAYNEPDFRPGIKTETMAIPKLDFSGGKENRWATFASKFPIQKDPYLADAQPLVPFPLAQVLPQLKGKTSVPIFLPTEIFASDLEVDYDVQTTPDSYEVGLYLTPGCRAGACYVGSFTAERNGQFTEMPDGQEINPMDTFRNIQLANGVQGVFYNACGAYCTAMVEWRSKDILYRVVGKNGEQADLVQLANSAIKAGAR